MVEEIRKNFDIVQKKLLDSMPVDFSFKKIESLTDELNVKPREGRIGKVPERSPNNKFITKSMWLDNNYLTSIIGMENFVGRFLEYPNLLSWIDFSFNKIKEIDDEITTFQNLIILYFHGNCISNIDTVFKLRSLRKLKRLTLHGNPISELPEYRKHIVLAMPQLFNLDFAPIIGKERNCIMPASLAKKLDFY